MATDTTYWQLHGELVKRYKALVSELLEREKLPQQLQQTFSEYARVLGETREASAARKTSSHVNQLKQIHFHLNKIPNLDSLLGTGKQ